MATVTVSKAEAKQRIKGIIDNDNGNKLRTLMAQIDCSHDWVPEGQGYKCQRAKCGYQTEANSEMNELIKIVVIAPPEEGEGVD